eukprot:gene644-852_t
MGIRDRSARMSFTHYDHNTSHKRQHLLNTQDCNTPHKQQYHEQQRVLRQQQLQQQMQLQRQYHATQPTVDPRLVLQQQSRDHRMQLEYEQQLREAVRQDFAKRQAQSAATLSSSSSNSLTPSVVSLHQPSEQTSFSSSQDDGTPNVYITIQPSATAVPHVERTDTRKTASTTAVESTLSESSSTSHMTAQDKTQTQSEEVIVDSDDDVIVEDDMSFSTEIVTLPVSESEAEEFPAETATETAKDAPSPSHIHVDIASRTRKRSASATDSPTKPTAKKLAVEVEAVVSTETVNAATPHRISPRRAPPVAVAIAPQLTAPVETKKGRKSFDA